MGTGTKRASLLFTYSNQKGAPPALMSNAQSDRYQGSAKGAHSLGALNTEVLGYAKILQRNYTNKSLNPVTVKNFITQVQLFHFKAPKMMPKRFLYLCCTVHPLTCVLYLHMYYIECTASRPLFRILFSNAK